MYKMSYAQDLRKRLNQQRKVLNTSCSWTIYFDVVAFVFWK